MADRVVAFILLVAVGVVAMTRLARPVLREFDQPAAAVAADLPDMRIDLNAASDAELAVLPGIGPRLAERIVADRDANGAYVSIEDLRRVRGIGPVTIERMTPFAVVTGKPSSE